MTPVLTLLHCFPVCFWTQFKMLELTFKALHGLDQHTERQPTPLQTNLTAMVIFQGPSSGTHAIRD